jgi:small-conductance mechanosensitive channel
MNKALYAMQNACQQAGKDESIRDHLLEEPLYQGWVEFTGWAVKVRLMVKTKEGKHWETANVLRRFSLEALHDQGIHIATPISG